MAQFGRAPGLGPGGRKFESCHLDFLLEKIQKFSKQYRSEFGARSR